MSERDISSRERKRRYSQDHNAAQTASYNANITFNTSSVYNTALPAHRERDRTYAAGHPLSPLDAFTMSPTSLASEECTECLTKYEIDEYNQQHNREIALAERRRAERARARPLPPRVQRLVDARNQAARREKTESERNCRLTNLSPDDRSAGSGSLSELETDDISTRRSTKAQRTRPGSRRVRRAGYRGYSEAA